MSWPLSWRCSFWPRQPWPLIGVGNGLAADRPTNAQPPPLRRAAAAALAIAAVAAYFLTIRNLFASRRPLPEDSAVLWASALMVVTLLNIIRPGADRAMKLMRYLSLVLLAGLCVAGFTVTSPVHFVFANVHDRASLLSTLVIMGAAPRVSRTWCRYLGPFGLALGAIGKHAVGLAYTKLGEFEKAERSIKEATELDPARVDTQISLGILAYRAGELEQAPKRWERALRLDAHNEYAKELLRRLPRLLTFG